MIITSLQELFIVLRMHCNIDQHKHSLPYFFLTLITAFRKLQNWPPIYGHILNAVQKRIPTLLLGFVLLASATSAHAESMPQPQQKQIRGLTPFAGTYRNRQYGFSLPPLGTGVYAPAPPNPNHGVLIVLGNERSITVSAAYDAAEFGSTKTLLDHWLENESPYSLRRSPTVLAGKPAEQAEFSTGQVFTKVIVQRRNVGVGILYALSLTSTQSNKAQDVKMFERVVGGFKIQPLPK